MCKECFKELQAAYNFKIRCEQTSQKLKLHVEENKEKSNDFHADDLNLITNAKENGLIATDTNDKKSKIEQLTCKICHRNFLHVSTFTRHVHMHTTGKSYVVKKHKTYQCSRCAKVPIDMKCISN